MPITNISKVHSKMIGICCLEETERNRVKAQWDSRFSERNSFWVDVALNSAGVQIIESIRSRIMEQNIITMAGEQCILAVFLDLRKPIAPEFLKTLWNLSGAIRSVLGCNVMAVLQFGYVGVLGLSSTEAQRANTKAAVNMNSKMPAAIQHRLCLVGAPVLAADGGNSWKATIIYLDALRRLTNPANLLPMTADGNANNDVGFLRYGEYNKCAYDALVSEKQNLEALKGNGGGSKLKTLLDHKREGILEEINSRFVIRGILHPQHPQMIVEDSLLNHRRTMARNGNNREYAAAQHETRTAVMLTGRRMKDEIIGLFEPEIKAARQTLEAMLKEATVGIELRQDKLSMQPFLSGVSRHVPEPPMPELLYKEAGCVEEINAYLMNMKAHAVSVGMSQFDAAINSAYEEILAKGFHDELMAIQERLEKVSVQVHAMGTAEQFCSDIAFRSNPPESDFNPISVPGSGMKFLMFRGQEMGAIVADVAQQTFLPIYEIQEVGGGIQKPDNAPLKAVQSIFLDCSDEALLQLMPEVNL